MGSYPYVYPWTYPYPYYPLYPQRPRRAPGETYALVISWIVTVAGGLSILCGLLVGLILAITLSLGSSDSLVTDSGFAAFIAAPLVGGAFAVYYGIRGIRRSFSPRFSLPHPAFFVGLTALLFVAGGVIWHVNTAPGSGVALVPLVVLSSALPALTVLAYTAWRLRMPTSRRHVWMSLVYGVTLGALAALILNSIGAAFIALLLQSIQPSSNPLAGDPTNPSAADPTLILFAVLLASVLAPLVEEGVKPLGAVLIMRRLRSPASAFLTGLAAGVGFSVFESVGLYIGRGEADWVIVAFGRIGAALLHGVGAGMGTLGWYYLINGKGVSRRWLRGFSCLLYAVLQHGLFNGTNILLAIAQGDFGHWLQEPLYIGRLPIDHATLLIFVYYALIAYVLVYMTGRLAAPTTGTPGAAAEASAPPQRDAAPQIGFVGSATR